MERLGFLSGVVAVVSLATRIASGGQENLTRPARPAMEAVSPSVAGGGQALTITGENLGKGLSAVYLTDGQSEWKLMLVEQTENLIRVAIPLDTPNGHFRLTSTSDDGVHAKQPLTVDVSFRPAGR